MKLLLDANISWKLISALKPTFGECLHVDFTELNKPAKDAEIWEYALMNACIIVTKDNDFIGLLESRGFPPKVVLLRTGNSRSMALAELLIETKPMIEDLVNSNYGLLEIVKGER
jgi:predicted nuclease of predicted toxin-antitoxin system